MALDAPSTYTIEFANDRGETIFLIDKHFGFQYSKSINGAGWFSLPIGFVDPRYLSVDNMIKFYRKAPGKAESIDFLGFLRKWSFTTSNRGNDTLYLSGPDQNDLVNRRIIAYAAGAAEASAKVGNVDDEIKAVVRENLGSLADADRDITSLSFSIQIDTSDGPTISKGFAWRKLDKVIGDLNKASRTDGNEVFWFIRVAGFDNAGMPNLELVTKIGQSGNDKRWNSTQTRRPMLFGLAYGNLQSPTLQFDYSDEANYAYVGGQGEGSSRIITEVQDSSRINASVWNRREMFVDARNQTTTAGMTAVANEKLASRRPKVRFSGEILSTEQTPYGSWGLGDLVTIQHAGYEFNAMIKNVLITVTPSGQETIRSQMEYEGTL